jgi:hypothetical protein
MADMRKRIGVGIIGLLLLACAGAATPRSTPTTKPASTATPLPTATAATPEEALRGAIQSKDIFGKLDDLQVRPSAGEPGKWLIEAHVQLADNLTTGFIVRGALIDYRDLSKAAYISNVPVQWFVFTGAFETKDQFGNTKMTDVVKIKMPSKTAAKINWDGITLANLYQV